jgi:hypothetical protein
MIVTLRSFQFMTLVRGRLLTAWPSAAMSAADPYYRALRTDVTELYKRPHLFHGRVNATLSRTQKNPTIEEQRRNSIGIRREP